MSPWAPRRPCLQAPLCPHLVDDAHPCPVHPNKRYWGNRPSASERGYGAAWQRIRERVLLRDGGRCTGAGCGQAATQVDHVIPKHKGGTDDDRNLTSLCRDCHNRKSGREGQAAR